MIVPKVSCRELTAARYAVGVKKSSIYFMKASQAVLGRSTLATQTAWSPPIAQIRDNRSCGSEVVPAQDGISPSSLVRKVVRYPQ